MAEPCPRQVVVDANLLNVSLGADCVSSLFQVLKGNENTYLEAKRDLNPPIRASRIRFLPYSFHRRTVCMRVELYGCQWNGKSRQFYQIT